MYLNSVTSSSSSSSKHLTTKRELAPVCLVREERANERRWKTEGKGGRGKAAGEIGRGGSQVKRGRAGIKMRVTQDVGGHPITYLM